MAILAYLLLSATLAVPAGEEKDTPKDQDKLQGVWRPTAAVSRGTVLPADGLQLPTLTLVVVGDRFVFNTIGGTLSLDPAKHTIDLDVKSGRYKGNTILGRYELTGDTLKLTLPTSMLNTARVPDLKAGEDGGRVTPVAQYTFQRDGKPAKEKDEAVLKDRIAALPEGKGGFGKQGGGGGGPGGVGGFGGGGFAGPAATQQLLQRILERLERIEERLDAMEKKLAPRESK